MKVRAPGLSGVLACVCFLLVVALACGGGGGGGGSTPPVTTSGGGGGGGGGGTVMPLNIVNVSPNSGSVLGTYTAIVLLDGGLTISKWKQPTYRLVFGAAELTSLSVLSDTKITGVVPVSTATTVSTVDVTLQIWDAGVLVAEGVVAGGFTYQPVFSAESGPKVTSVFPITGLVGGGETVTVSGADFSYNAVVSFGGTAATSTTWMGSTSLKAVVPAATGAATVSLTVTNIDGQSAVLPNSFQYVTAALLSGTVVASPVQNGNMSASGVISNKFTQLATAKTDSAGNFSLDVGAYRGPVRISVTSGSYVEESNGNTVSIISSFPITIMLPRVSGSMSGISVTPLTTIAGVLATQRMNQGGGLAEAESQAQNANEQIRTLFKLSGDITQTVPVDLTTGPTALPATDPTVEAAFVLAGFSGAAELLQSNSIYLMDALALDLAAEGTLNGQQAGGASVPVEPQLNPLPADSLTVQLPQAIQAFETNVRNLSGLGAGANSALVTALQGASATVAAPPQLAPTNAIVPASGPYVGGTNVTISGSGFDSQVEVYFGALASPSNPITSTGSTIACVTPSAPISTVDVLIKNLTSKLTVSKVGGFQFTNNNNPPSVSQVTVTGASGDITVNYKLADTDGDACSVKVQYRGGSKGVNWSTPTTTPALDAAGEITGLLPGDLSLVWHSATDEGTIAATDYEFRFIPSDGKPGTATTGQSAPFAVDNGGGAVTNNPPSVVNVAPTGTSPLAGDVTLTFGIIDLDGDTCSLTKLEYSTDGGANWKTGLPAPSSPLGSYTSNTTGSTSNTVIWDSATGEPTLNSATVQVRVTVSDGKAGTATAGASASFAVNNTQGGGNQLPAIQNLAVTSPAPLSGNITFSFDVVDPDSTKIDALRVQYVGGSKTVPTDAVIDISKVDVPVGAGQTFVWQSRSPTNEKDQESSYTITLTPVQGTGAAAQDGTPASLSNLVIDNKGPAFTGAVLSPNGGEALKGGTATTISWTTAPTDTNPNAGAAIDIYYSKDSGSTWPQTQKITTTALPMSATSHSWTTPSIDSATVRVRLVATDALGNQSTLTSAANFIIDSTPPVVALSPSPPNGPNGGELWIIKTASPITWTTTDTSATTVLVELSNDGFVANVITVAPAGTADVGTTSYTPVAADVDTKWRARVTATDQVGNVGSVTSAADFTIEYILKPLTISAGSEFQPMLNTGVDTVSVPGDVSLIRSQEKYLSTQYVNHIAGYDRDAAGLTYIVGTKDGAYLTTDGGTSFTHFSSMRQAGASPLLPTRECKSADFYAPNPNGAQAAVYPPPAPPTGKTDPAGKVFALGFLSGGLCVTRDGGKTFQSWSDNTTPSLPSRDVSAIAFHNNWATDGKVYLVCTNQGSVMTTDGGKTFPILFNSASMPSFGDNCYDGDILDADLAGDKVLIGTVLGAMNITGATTGLPTMNTIYSGGAGTHANSVEFLQSDSSGQKSIIAFGTGGAGELWLGNAQTGTLMTTPPWGGSFQTAQLSTNDIDFARFNQSDTSGKTFAAALRGAPTDYMRTTKSNGAAWTGTPSYGRRVAYLNGTGGLLAAKIVSGSPPTSLQASSTTGFSTATSNGGSWSDKKSFATYAFEPTADVADVAYAAGVSTGATFAVVLKHSTSAGANNAAVYFTTNGGSTFSTATYGSMHPTSGIVYPSAAALDYQGSSGVLLVAHDQGLTKWTISGSTLTFAWTKTKTQFNTNSSACWDVAIHAASSNFILVGMDEHALVSYDGGSTWKRFDNTRYPGYFANTQPAGANPVFHGVAWLDSKTNGDIFALANRGGDTTIVTDGSSAIEGAATRVKLTAGTPHFLTNAEHYAVDFDENDATGNTLLLATKEGIFRGTAVLGATPTYDYYHDGTKSPAGPNVTNKSTGVPALKTPSLECEDIEFYDYANPSGNIWAGSFPNGGGVWMTWDGGTTFRSLFDQNSPPFPGPGARKIKFLQHTSAKGNSFGAAWVGGAMGATMGKYGYILEGTLNATGPRQIDPSTPSLAGSDTYYGVAKLSATITTPTSTSIKWHFFDQNDQPISDTVLAGNSTGLSLDTNNEIDLRALTSLGGISKLGVRAKLASSDPTASPSIQDFTLTFRYQ